MNEDVDVVKGTRVCGVDDTASSHIIFPDTVYMCAQDILQQYAQRGLTISCAESCTAGLLAASLTEPAGASEVIVGGCVCYAIRIKRDLLGVSNAVLCDPAQGVYSSFCAAQMAQGVRKLYKSSIGIAITGIAGPSGAEDHKPVGTVWFSIAYASGYRCLCKHFEGDRNFIRTSAVKFAEKLLLDFISPAQA